MEAYQQSLAAAFVLPGMLSRAEALDLSTANVGLRLFRGRRMLQEKMSFVKATLRRVPRRKGMAAGVLAALGSAGSAVPAEASAGETGVRGAAATRRLAALALPVALGVVATLAVFGRLRNPARVPESPPARLASLVNVG